MNKEKIAMEYELALDEFDTIPREQIHFARAFINKQFQILSDKIYFDFVDTEPYDYNTIEDMLKDFNVGVIKVNTTGNESKYWGTVYNLIFRAVHDYFHCQAKLGFTFDEEVKIWKKQVEYNTLTLPKLLDNNLLTAVLRSEIVYQGAYKEVTGKFHINQKIVLKDFLTL